MEQDALDGAVSVGSSPEEIDAGVSSLNKVINSLGKAGDWAWHPERPDDGSSYKGPETRPTRIGRS
jgi:hypothetical protein